MYILKHQFETSDWNNWLYIHMHECMHIHVYLYCMSVEKLWFLIHSIAEKASELRAYFPVYENESYDLQE